MGKLTRWMVNGGHVFSGIGALGALAVLIDQFTGPFTLAHSSIPVLTAAGAVMCLGAFICAAFLYILGGLFKDERT